MEQRAKSMAFWTKSEARAPAGPTQWDFGETKNNPQWRRGRGRQKDKNQVSYERECLAAQRKCAADNA
jgi:hypothetical protein